MLNGLQQGRLFNMTRIRQLLTHRCFSPRSLRNVRCHLAIQFMVMVLLVRHFCYYLTRPTWSKFCKQGNLLWISTPSPPHQLSGQSYSKC